MRISCIYKITNLIDDKVYIGQTTNYCKRKTSHFASLKRGKHCNEHLQRAFNKYGDINFAIEIIKECEPEDLDYWEIYYIDKYKACNKKFGYNLIDGGQKYRHHTKEVRAKISKRLKGRKFSNEHKEKIAKSNRDRAFTQEQLKIMARKCNETKKKKQIGWGEKNANAIISDKEAEQLLLEAYRKKKIIVKNLAQKFNVTENVVYNLLENKSYTHLLKEKRQAIKNKHNDYRQNKYKEVLEMLNKGYSQNYIAHKLKISRNTIRKLISY